MANTQINIAKNGKTTLATAGMYCDRNIDVNVDVPPVGITPTGTLNITENGTHDVANYASAKVNVAGGQATAFTNLYDPANVVLQKCSNCSAANGASFDTDKQVNYLVIPYHHKANEPVVIRMRGIGTVRDRQGFTVFGSDGATVVSWGALNGLEISYDEYGDAMITFTTSGGYFTKEWHYLHLNFQYIGKNTGVTTAYTGPIVTINEPIGNGGYVG